MSRIILLSTSIVIGWLYGIDWRYMDIEKVIKHFGGVKALCRVLNVYAQSIYQWKERGIPLARQYEIEQLSKGKFIADRSHLNQEVIRKYLS